MSTDTLGDLVLREPLFRLASAGGVEVGLVVRESFAEAAALIAPFAAIFTLRANPYSSGEGELGEEAGRVADAIRQWNPSVAVCLLKAPNRFDHALFSRLDGIGRWCFAVTPASRLSFIQRRMDGERTPAPPAEVTISVREDEHELEAYAAVLNRMGIAFDAGSFRPRLARSAPVAGQLDSSADFVAGRYVVCCPEGTQNVAMKSWPVATRGRMVRFLRENHDLACVFVGVPSEENALRETARDCGAQVWIGGPGKLAELCALIGEARAYVGTDTGPMHLAAAMDIPVFGLFGGGTWGRFFPVTSRSVVVTERLPCFGCGWACVQDAPRCLTDIPWERIRAGLDFLLEEVSAPGHLVLDGGPVRPGSFALAERLGAKWVESETDGAARLASARTLEVLLKESEADREARLDVISRLDRQLVESESDRAARWEIIQRLQQEVARYKAEFVRKSFVRRWLERLSASFFRKQ